MEIRPALSKLRVGDSVELYPMGEADEALVLSYLGMSRGKEVDYGGYSLKVIGTTMRTDSFANRGVVLQVVANGPIGPSK